MPKQALYLLNEDKTVGSLAGIFPGTPTGDFLLKEAIGRTQHLPGITLMQVNNIPDDAKLPDTWNVEKPADVSGYEAHIAFLREALEKAHRWAWDAVDKKDLVTLPVDLLRELDATLMASSSRWVRKLGTSGVVPWLKDVVRDNRIQQRANGIKRRKLAALRAVVRGPYRKLRLDYAALQAEATGLLQDLLATADVVEQMAKACDGLPSTNHWPKEQVAELVKRIRELRAPVALALPIEDVRNIFGEEMDAYLTNASRASLQSMFEQPDKLQPDTVLPFLPKEAIEKLATEHPERSAQFASLLAHMAAHKLQFISFQPLVDAKQ